MHKNSARGVGHRALELTSWTGYTEKWKNTQISKLIEFNICNIYVKCHANPSKMWKFTHNQNNKPNVCTRGKMTRYPSLDCLLWMFFSNQMSLLSIKLFWLFNIALVLMKHKTFLYLRNISSHGSSFIMKLNSCLVKSFYNMISSLLQCRGLAENIQLHNLSSRGQKSHSKQTNLARHSKWKVVGMHTVL